MAVDERTMFEIYRESDYNRAFHYVFYTDLEEHGRDDEIARAAAGEMVFTGYLADASKESARVVVESIVDELNEMDEDEAGLPEQEIRSRLAEFLVAGPAV